MIRTNSLVASITITTTAIVIIIATTATVAETRIVTGERVMRVGMVRSTTRVIRTIVLTSERDRIVDMTPDMMEEEIILLKVIIYPLLLLTR